MVDFGWVVVAAVAGYGIGMVSWILLDQWGRRDSPMEKAMLQASDFLTEYRACLAFEAGRVRPERQERAWATVGEVDSCRSALLTAVGATEGPER